MEAISRAVHHLSVGDARVGWGGRTSEELASTSFDGMGLEAVKDAWHQHEASIRGIKQASISIITGCMHQASNRTDQLRLFLLWWHLSNLIGR